MQCSRCGRPYQVEDRFCHACGMSIPVSQGEPPASTLPTLGYPSRSGSPPPFPPPSRPRSGSPPPRQSQVGTPMPEPPRWSGTEDNTEPRDWSQQPQAPYPPRASSPPGAYNAPYQPPAQPYPNYQQGAPYPSQERYPPPAARGVPASRWLLLIGMALAVGLTFYVAHTYFMVTPGSRPASPVAIDSGTGAPPPTSEAPAGQFVGATMCKSLSADYAPIGPTEIYQPTEKFNCSVQYHQLREGQSIRIRWMKDGEELKHTVYSAKGAISSGYISFSLKTPDPWPSGRYGAELYFDDMLVKKLSFKVAHSE